MSLPSANLSSLISHDVWDRLNVTAAEEAALMGPYSTWRMLFDERMGMPGMANYETRNLVPPGLPTARTTLESLPDTDTTVLLGNQSVSFTDYRKTASLNWIEFHGMVARGTLDAYVRKLQGRCWSRAIASLATYIDGHNSSSVAPIPSPSGSGTDALSASHTLLTGGTYSNLGTATLTSDNVAAAYETLYNNEVDPKGGNTFPIPRFVWAGVPQRREARQAVESEVSSAALQANVNQDLMPIVLPGLTSTDWGLSADDNGLFIAFSAGVDPSQLPEELRGLGLDVNGMPYVHPPVFDVRTKQVYFVYGTTFVIGAEDYHGFWGSTGAG